MLGVDLEADPLVREKGRGIPSLDGLRAFSILLVLVAHASDGVAGTRTLGSFGVRVFFVISGFLITTLLLGETDRTGRVNLGHFYLRRTLRIFPPYYLYVAVVSIFTATGVISAQLTRYWPALTYTSNWFSTGSWWLGHSWSLSVEEQFYLAWPLAIATLGRGRALTVSAAMLLAAPAIRCLLYLLTRDGSLADNFNFDFIAAGCALALLSARLQESRHWARLHRGSLPPLLVALALALHMGFADSYRWRFLVEMVAVQPFEALALALFLSWCVTNATGKIGRALNAAPMRAIGIASYSIYLWQQVVFGVLEANPWYTRIAVAIAVGAVSYFLVERPSLAFRRLIERRSRVVIPRIGDNCELSLLD